MVGLLWGWIFVYCDAVEYGLFGSVIRCIGYLLFVFCLMVLFGCCVMLTPLRLGVYCGYLI